MPIDFHSTANRDTYARRSASPGWAAAMRGLVDPAGARVVDLGCGGGVYSTAWLELGAAAVVGVDFSAPILDGARERAGDRPGLTFRQGDATDTGLPDNCADAVFARALVHHLSAEALRGCFAEARRLLAPGGTLIVQDRTAEDALRPGSATHLRGWFAAEFPRLAEVERARRPSSEQVASALAGAGFTGLSSRALEEERRSYANAAEVRADLLARTGRSILHELDDAELAVLADRVASEVGEGPVRESDFWTVWSARAPE